MDFLKVLSPKDPELVEKTLARLNEQDTWNDVFSTKLIELLDNMDSIKAEMRSMLRSLNESAAEAKRQTEKAGDELLRAREANEAVCRELHRKRIELATTMAALESAVTTARDELRLAKAAQESFVGVVAQAQQASIKTCRDVARYLTLLASGSWLGTIWGLWFGFRASWDVWVPLVVSAAIAAAGTLFLWRSRHAA
jgi:hypothetical protein